MSDLPTVKEIHAASSACESIVQILELLRMAEMPPAADLQLRLSGLCEGLSRARPTIDRLRSVLIDATKTQPIPGVPVAGELHRTWHQFTLALAETFLKNAWTKIDNESLGKTSFPTRIPPALPGWEYVHFPFTAATQNWQILRACLAGLPEFSKDQVISGLKGEYAIALHAMGTPPTPGETTT